MRTTALLLFIALVMSMSFATIVVNSMDGRDVISAVSYGNVIGEKVLFVYPGLNEDPLRWGVFLSKVGDNITIIQSSENPVYSNLKDVLEASGKHVNDIVSINDPSDANLMFASMSNAEGYILVNPDYGFPAVSSLPYAKLNHYYIVFAFKDKAGEIVKLVEGKPVLVYGYIPNDVEVALKSDGVGYEKIYAGDKYTDNIEIIKKYLSEKDVNQFIATDGNMLEDTIDDAAYPILFVSTIVPEATFDFVKSEAERKEMVVISLVNKEYVNALYNLKSEINNELGREAVKVFVKMGQGLPSVTPHQVPLDVFILPGPFTNLNITSLTYDPERKQVEVVVSASGNAPAFFTADVKVTLGNESIGTFSIPLTEISPGDEKGFSFDLNIPEEAEGDLVASITVMYGLSKNTLDSGFILTENISRIVYNDMSNVTIENAIYKMKDKVLTFMLKNNGDKRVYASVKVVSYDGENYIDFSDDKVWEIEPHRAVAVKYVDMPFPDKVENITITTTFGERRAFMRKTFSIGAEIDKGMDILLMGGIALLIVVIIAVILFMRRKKNNR